MRLFFLVAIAGAGLAASAAFAHHGFTGRYDAARPIWIEGVIERASFSPPHPTISIRIDGAARPAPDLRAPAELTGPITPDGRLAGQSVEVEFPPVNAFHQMGSQVKAGDRVALIALRNCSPPHQLRSQWLKTAAGVIIERAGRMSYQVNGC